MMEAIDRKARKMTGVLIRWYFTGELDCIIKELEEDSRGKARSKDIVITLGRKEGVVSDLFTSSGLFNPEADQLEKLKEAKKRLDRFFNRLNNVPDGTTYKEILRLFYGQDNSIFQTSVTIGLAEPTIKLKKREVLDELISYLRVS
ncbi:hypothetical protein [Orenia marismortui]|uniref:hypothetical protein n=1 Tax=Orenia marismortui TaxID=46469 RepID=UPI00038069AD|nr:hypothetical protein [Orenia marismortui]